MAVVITGDVSSIITGVATLCGVIGNLVLQFRLSKQVDAVKESTANNRESIKVIGGQVEAVHKATNSLTDKLVASTALASHQEGVTAGVALEKERVASSFPP